MHCAGLAGSRSEQPHVAEDCCNSCLSVSRMLNCSRPRVRCAVQAPYPDGESGQAAHPIDVAHLRHALQSNKVLNPICEQLTQGDTKCLLGEERLRQPLFFKWARSIKAVAQLIASWYVRLKQHQELANSQPAQSSIVTLPKGRAAIMPHRMCLSQAQG